MDTGSQTLQHHPRHQSTPNVFQAEGHVTQKFKCSRLSSGQLVMLLPV